MILLAQHLKVVSPSPIFLLAIEARKLRSKGIKIFDFTIGEPDFDTPENVKSAAYSAIKNGKTKYTAVDGIKELKDEVVKKYSHRLNLSADNVIISAGAKQVIFNALFATINEGDEVIIPAPYWSSYPEMVKLSKGNPIIAICNEASGFKVTPEILERLITDKTKWLILNSPNNPTGAKYSEEELVNLSEVLAKHPNVYVLSDDIYEDISYDSKPYSIIDYAGSIKDRVFIAHGVSKSYAMTGWRVGYGIGPVDLIVAMATIQSQTTSGPCSVSQYTAVEALSNSSKFIESSVGIFAERMERASALLTNIPGLSFVKPQGAFYFFINCKEFIGKQDSKGNLIENDVAFCKYLLEEAKAMVVPGSAFGVEGYFRMSYATSLEVLEKGIKSIEAAVGRIQTP